MGRHIWKSWLLLILGALITGTIQAEELTVESLIGLKSLGFSETEIQQQVKTSGTVFQLTETQTETLRKAGFSDAMIRFLNQPPEQAPPAPANAPPAGVGEDRIAPIAKPQEPDRTPPAEPAAVVPPAPRTPPEAQPPPMPPAPIPPAVSRQQLLEIQQILNALGYDAGSPDGIMGRRTAAAIRDFQQANGLAVNGQADERLLARLRDRLRESGRTLPPHGNNSRLLGEWQTVYQGGYGYATEMILYLAPDGSFSSSSSSAMGYAEASGTYQVQGNTLTLLNQYGQSQGYPFRLLGDQLYVRMPGIAEEVVFRHSTWEAQ